MALDENASALLKADPGLASLCSKMEKSNDQAPQKVAESVQQRIASDKPKPKLESTSAVDALIDGDVKAFIPRPKIKVDPSLKEFEVLPDQSPTQAVSQIPTVPPVKPVLTAPEDTEKDKPKQIRPPVKPSNEPVIDPVDKDKDLKNRILLMEKAMSNLLGLLKDKNLITESECKLLEGIIK